MSLANALSNAKTYIMAGDDVESACTDAAQEFDLNPKLVLNRLIEQMGCPVGEISAKLNGAKEALAKATVSNVEDKVKTAMQVAQEWRAKYTGQPNKFTFKEFVWKDEKYIFVVVDRACRKWGIKAVRVSDAAPRQFPLGAWGGIAPQIGD
jgi:hypothetical protein